MKHASPFHIWHKRIGALRCRYAVLFCNGNQARAAKLIGLDGTTLCKILRADDALLDERAAREGWQPEADSLPADFIPMAENDDCAPQGEDRKRDGYAEQPD